MAAVLDEYTLGEQRCAVRFLWKKGLPAKDIHWEMLSVYSENCLSHQVVYCNIVSKFRDEIQRKGCPSLLTRGEFCSIVAKPHTARIF
ncbi:hypothetical protein AVEN_208079-1 [Araneus ventricosus]|uniref:Uncharacterized protein n=1 Tax=Araneus ventricosus TaxID=182803 RepID=A0A4Y2K7N8_ARAVE|nr:hypothetical protein AVEN_208079-1 [Araneus ventricosus]